MHNFLQPENFYVSGLYLAIMSTATDRVSELPFLDLGDEARVSGEGKFFGILDFALMLNDTELPSSFPFDNGTETEIYVSYINFDYYMYCTRFRTEPGFTKCVSTPELDSNRFANRIDRCESKSHSMRIHRVHTTSSTILLTKRFQLTCMFAHDSHSYTNTGWRYRELH